MSQVINVFLGKIVLKYITGIYVKIDHHFARAGHNFTNYFQIKIGHRFMITDLDWWDTLLYVLGKAIMDLKNSTNLVFSLFSLCRNYYRAYVVPVFN